MQFTKHIHVLHLLSTIPAPSVDEAGQTYASGLVSAEDAIAAFDHMFTYIFDHWAKPMSASPRRPRATSAEQQEYIDCRDMLCMNPDELVAKLESLPPYFREEIFPAAVARYMLRDMRLPFHFCKSTMFVEFVARYGNMILSC